MARPSVPDSKRDSSDREFHEHKRGRSDDLTSSSATTKPSDGYGSVHDFRPRLSECRKYSSTDGRDGASSGPSREDILGYWGSLRSAVDLYGLGSMVLAANVPMHLWTLDKLGPKNPAWFLAGPKGPHVDPSVVEALIWPTHK